MTFLYFRALVICLICKFAELFPCSSCGEIYNLDSKARSGLYVIETEGGTLEQASLFVTDA